MKAMAPAIGPPPSTSAAPISTAAAPFSKSSSRVAAASPLRPVRSTLVAPIFPDPIWRRSPAPVKRVSSRPKGIEPSI